METKPPLHVSAETTSVLKMNTAQKGLDVTHIQLVPTKMEWYRTPHASVARVSALVLTGTAQKGLGVMSIQHALYHLNLLHTNVNAAQRNAMQVSTVMPRKTFAAQFHVQCGISK